MSNYHFLFVPKENANDSEVLVVSVQEGGTRVKSNSSILAEFEGSKAITEFVTPHTGIFYPFCNVGERVNVLSLFGLVADDILSDKKVHEIHKSLTSIGVESGAMAAEIDSLKATGPAIDLMRLHGVQEKELAHLEIIKKQDVENYLVSKGIKTQLESRPELSSVINRVAVIGAGTGGLIAADIIMKQPSVRLVGYYDDNTSINSLLGFPLLGSIDPEKIYNDFVSGLFDSVIITLGSRVDLRDRIFNELCGLGVNFHNAIHPSCVIAGNVDLGVGNLIAAHTVIGPFASLGSNNFISSSCVIEHHNKLGRSSSFGPGVMFSGTVSIKDRILFGTGIFVEPYVCIDSDCIISSGSIITKNIPKNSVVKAISNIKIVSREI